MIAEDVVGLLQETSKIGGREINRPQALERGEASVAAEFGAEFRRFKNAASGIISQFRLQQRENPNIDLKQEEGQLVELAGNFDDLTAKSELGLGLIEEEREALFQEDSVVIDVEDAEDDQFRMESMFDRFSMQGAKEEYGDSIETKRLSEEDKKALERKVSEAIPLFKANSFTEQEVDRLLGQIQAKIEAETDQEKLSLYKELADFINRNGCIFTEFSHGTNAISLPGILDKGILPWFEISEDALYKGEGAKINRRIVKEKSVFVHAGAGQFGLGLAIGYARREDDPLWKDGTIIDDFILDYVDLPVPSYFDRLLQTGKDPWMEYETERHLAYVEAYKRMSQDKANTWFSSIYQSEFPLVLGFARTRTTQNIVDCNYYTTCTFEGLVPGQVAFSEGDCVEADAINVIACSKRGEKSVREMLRGNNRQNIEIVSLEALDLLPEFGIDEVKRGEGYVFEYLSKGKGERFRRIIDLDEKLIERRTRLRSLE